MIQSAIASQAEAGQPYAATIDVTDPDGDALTIRLAESPAWLSLQFDPNGDATLRGTPAGPDVGDHTVVIEIEDAGSPPLSVRETVVVVVAPAMPAIDFRDEVIYWAMTDRFANGDPSNDNGDLSRIGDAADRTNPVGWHGGDFAGIRQKIEEGYFQRMGFTAIWVSPVVLQVPPSGNGGGPNANQIFASYHGYVAEDFFRIEPHFGALDELRALVDTARQNDIEILIDVVLNHAGPGAELVNSEPDWFRTGAECGNDEVTQCLFGLPDFIQSEPDARAFLFSTIRFLREQVGMTGFRMDTMKHVPDDFWQEFFARGGAGDPSRVWTVGEVFDGSVMKLARYLDDLGSPSVLDFPLQFAMRDAIARGGSVATLTSVFAQDVNYDDPTRLSLFVDNHDIRRFVSEAVGSGTDRDGALVRLRAALTFMFAARGIPVVYYGTEIGMTGEGDPYALPLGQSNREDMDFTALANSDIDELLGELAAMRSAYPALRRGTQRTLWPNGTSDCAVADAGRDSTAAFGVELFVRGSFNGWAANPGGNNLVNLDDRFYAAEVEMSAAAHEYKIADAGWSVELGVSGAPTLLDFPQLIGPVAGGAEGNADISIAETGCYRWEIDSANAAAPLLTVSRVGDASNVLAFARELTGETSLLALLNNSDTAIDLVMLPGGGLPVDGVLSDGLALDALTGAGGEFQVNGGLLMGNVAPRTVRVLVSAGP
ncbi:MAG: alpha-amylase family glycosyl hydrolase [Gammaproteobacteria bacterium]|nr:alpha-amylase family glycosyl hydrolase [Gammaproteobacteria bacterium]